MAVLLASLVFVFFGMTGLGVDFAFATLEKRTLQNAADAAATSGAINLARGESPVNDVNSMVTRNGAANTTVVLCQYVDNSNAVVGGCDAAAPGSSSGVRVTATNTRPTYFMRVLGIPTYTASANSAARVVTVSPSSPYPSSASLFIVCGLDTLLAGPGNHKMDILQRSGGDWVPNPSANGREFVIHNPTVADCDMRSSAFKGLNAIGAQSGPISLPFNMITETGTRAGPTSQAVRGIDGCQAGLYSDSVNNCVMVIPVFVSAPAKDVAYSVRWLAFYVRQIDSNTHYGRLILDYTIGQEAYTMYAPWTKNTKQVLTAVRLWN